MRACSRSPSRYAGPAGPQPDRPAPAPAVARQALRGRPGVGTGAPRQAIARSGSPPRAPPDDGGDRVTPGSTRSSGRPAPSGARDAPARRGRGSPGSGSPVPMLQRPPQRRRNRPRPGPDLHHPPVLVVPHHHPACVAGQPLGRFRGNVAPFVQHGLAGLLRIRQDRGVHVDHHVIPLPRGPGIELVMQRRLGQQRQRVGLLLRPGRKLLGRVGGRQADLGGAAPLVQRLAGRVERAQEQRAHLRRQPPAEATVPSSSW